MTLPSIERNSSVRPVAAEAVLSKASATIPVAPVNPTVQASPPLVPQPSVVNHVNPALQGADTRPANEGEPVYTSVPDPVRRNASSQAQPHDWTIKHPVAEKVEEPPKKPMSEMLLDHLKSIWSASASAVQVQQVSNQVTPPTHPTPSQVPGELAKQMLTYQPSKIPKNEKL